jgi:tRNA (guanine37-N1)-methyltransferase
MSRTKEDELRRNSKKLGSQSSPRILATGGAVEMAGPRSRISTFIMNLPDSAIQFLDVFRGILAPGGTDDFRHIYDVMPMVHCYCFTRELETIKAEADIRSVCILQSYLIYAETCFFRGWKHS